MKLSAALIALALCTLAGAAHAQDQAFTNRSTELKADRSAESRALATLPKDTAVKVLARGGEWTRVEAGGQSGWVRVFHLRYPAVAQAESSSGNPLAAVTSAMGFGKGNQKATTGTLGVRGLDKAAVQSATPDAQALRQLQSLRADQPTAERFAREGKLNAVSVDYEGGGRR
jgi:Bacterial SH3 domain